MSSKTIMRGSSADDVISSAKSTVEELAQEMRSWADSLEEKFSQTEKYSTVSETADNLEGIDWPEVPESLSDLGVQWSETKSGKRPSRRKRCESVVDSLRGLYEALESRRDELQEQIDLRSEDETDEEEPEALQDACTELMESVEVVIDTLESCEFPGAFG